MSVPWHGRTTADRRHRSSLASIVKTEDVIPDDRDDIVEGDAVLLIVDDDPHYSRVLLGLARDRGFKGIVANRGGTALALAREFMPTAITLDVFLPDMLGWTVLNNLKLDPTTRHIPVQMLSVEEERQHGLSHGAFSYLVKPATTEALEGALDRIKTYAEPQTRQLLVIEDNKIERDSIVDLLAYDDISITAVGTAADAMAALDERRFDCVVVDLRLPDVSGFELLEMLRGHERMVDVPIVVFTGKELSVDEELRAAGVRQERRAQGRALARTSLRRDRALPASRDEPVAGGKAATWSTGCTAPTTCSAAGRCWSSTTTPATSLR